MELYKLFLECSCIVIDSRSIETNCLFFAIKGEAFDGNAFAEEALDKGAKYVVIDDVKWKKDDRYILVEDSLTALQKLAKVHRDKLLNTSIIAIAGSNGKTTTKDLIATVLATTYPVFATPTNLNNHIGIPLSILKIKPSDQYAVIEIGANALGEHTALCNIIEPHYGVVTNFGKDHLEGYGSIDGVIASNSELYTYLKNSKGTVFINQNDTLQVSQSKGLNCIYYGKNEPINGAVETLFPFITVSCNVYNNNIKIKTKLFGSFQLQNILTALAIGHYFGVDPKNCKTAIEQFTPNNNRSQLIDWQGNKILLDAYNANPSSLVPMIKDFEHYPAERKIIIIGAMFELGDFSQQEHQNVIDLLSQCESFEEILLVGESFKYVKKAKDYQLFLNYKAVKLYLEAKSFDGYFLLVKGSRGLTLEKIFC